MKYTLKFAQKVEAIPICSSLETWERFVTILSELTFETREIVTPYEGPTYKIKDSNQSTLIRFDVAAPIPDVGFIVGHKWDP